MFFTRLPLDINRRSTLRAMENPNHFHGAIEQSFEENPGRILWRIDKLYNHYYLYIVSAYKPDCSGLMSQFGDKNDPAQTKDYDFLLNKIEKGSIWKFKLVANPTYRKDGNEKVHPHMTVAYQQQWLEKKSQSCGFSIVPDTLKISKQKYFSFKKGHGNHLISFLSVTYDGILMVDNVELFRKALTEGIGREKPYGCGLLTVMKG